MAYDYLINKNEINRGLFAIVRGLAQSVPYVSE